MNTYEKIGLFMIIAFFGFEYPDSWNGGEILIELIGSILFFGGSYVKEVVDAFRAV